MTLESSEIKLNSYSSQQDESNWFKDSSPYTDELQNAETV